MKHNMHNFVGLFTVMTLVFGANLGQAAVPSNPRGSSVDASAGRTNTGTTPRVVQRTAANNLTVRGTPNRNTGNVGTPGRVSARGAVTSNAIRGGSATARTAATTHDVSGTGLSVNSNRSATNSASRAGVARATAVFSDISKIGGGYADCRDAYATCMDQFCANANDTYRRCFCSSRFTEFRDTEEALDQAKTLLMQFEDNNLNAVDKTAAEVNAMYSATVGEAAIKKDTSGAAKILDQISDLLSGKKTTTTNNDRSLGLISFDTLTGEIDDIWSSNSDSIFNVSSGKNLSELEGNALYNASNSQCMAMMGENCSSDAVLQMARSSYSIMISQDCNAYEKKINSQRESVKQTVRTAEKYLRDARLDEYRAHNSADVNECITLVRSAVLADTACGTGYKRCLDFSGRYINPTTGEPRYEPYLFELANVITLNGDSDVLAQNQSFAKELDRYRLNAASALDTCRDIADTVWTEFKRSALIEIAQAQDEKIEKVKMSCVSTMADCYDATTNALKEFDITTAKAAGAVGAYAARSMCAEKVAACAALYGNNGSSACNFGTDGKITNAEKCGLTALWDFVNTVDTSRIAESCDVAVENYLKDLCTPSEGVYGYPYNCRTMKFGDIAEYDNSETNPETIWAQIGRFVKTNCKFTGTEDNSSFKTNMDNQIKDKTNRTLENIKSSLGTMLADICTNTYDGTWLDYDEEYKANMKLSFYTNVYGGNKTLGSSYGMCIENSVKARCEVQDADTGGYGYAKYDKETGECIFDDAWYKIKCENIDGVWENNACLVVVDAVVAASGNINTGSVENASTDSSAAE